MRLLSRQRLRRGAAAVLSAIVICVSIPFIPGVSDDYTSYADEYWAEPYLQNMVDEGIMTGNAKGNLNPSDEITRAEFVTMINRALGFTTTTDIAFTDVKDTDWYYDEIAKGYYEGYFQGVGNNLAQPDSPITREAAVTMLCRALQLPTDPLVGNSFTDNTSISNWSRPYVNIASQKGIVSGYTDGTFGPTNSVTRAEVAKIISNLAGTIVDEPRQVRLDYVDGNVTLNESGGGLRNTTIAGDLYITDGVGTGNILLDNVTVLGQVIISGGGESSTGDCSVIFKNCDINELYVDAPNGKKVALSTQGNTVITDTYLKSDAYIESANSSGSPFKNMTIDTATGQAIDLVGNFDNVKVLGQGNTLNLQKGSITSLTVDEDALGNTVYLADGTDVSTVFCDGPANVKGKGGIGKAIINTKGTVIEQLPDEVNIRPGISANINKQDMTDQQASNVNVTPEIYSGYPKISEETINSAKATFRVNKPGKLYWVVIPDGYTAPTAAQMINPNLIGSAVASGNQNISDDLDTIISLTKLTQGTDYVIYGMLVDQREVQSAIKKASFTTVDNTTPKFTYTKVDPQTVENDDGTYSYNIAAVATVSKNATVYYAVERDGLAALSATELVSQRISADAKGFTDFQKNISRTITLTGLQENTKYNIYMVAVDDNGRQSAVYSAAVTTDDTTAPEILRLSDTQGNTNIQVKFTPDENCARVYWALYYSNSSTVSTIEDGEAFIENGLVWYETDTARDLIIRASGAVQSSSNLNATANVEKTFNIANLEKERYYKLYIVLEDSSGNRSSVYLLNTATIDNSDPTVQLSYGSTDGTNLYVGSASAPTSISLVFSEVVRGRLGEGITEFDSLTTTNMSALSTWIKLYKGNASAVTDSSNDITSTINWTQVTTTTTVASEESPEHTVITFSVSNENGTALNLNTGETYTFVFTYNAASSIYICDKSGNTMKKIPTSSASGGNYTAVTQTFKCVEPSVSLSSPAGAGSEITYDVDGDGSAETHYLDLTYKVNPTTANRATADEQKYDYYFTASANVVVNIFQRRDNGSGSGDWELIGEDVILTADDELKLESGTSATSARVNLEGKSAVSSNDYSSQQFNEMPDTTILAVEVVQYEYNLNRDTWTGAVTVRTACVMGTVDYLYRKANNPADTTQVVTQVGSADDTVSFTDSVPPVVKYEIANEDTDVHETDVTVTLTPDKDITLYWVAVKGDFATALNPDMRKTTNQIYSFIQAQSNPDNIYQASGIALSVMQGTQTITITDLEPDVEYTIYFVARSKDGGQLSEYTDSTNCITSGTDDSGNAYSYKQYVEFTTSELIAPVFQPVSSTTTGTSRYVQILTDESGGDTVAFSMLTDRPADIYWTVCTSPNYDEYSKVIASDPMEIKQPSQKSTNSKGETYVQTSGMQSSSRSANQTGNYETDIRVTGLTASTQYYIFALATNVVNNDIYTSEAPQYVSYGKFVVPDKKAPTVQNVYITTWTPVTSIQNGAIEATVDFDKSLYYQISDATGSYSGETKILTSSDVKKSANWSFTPSSTSDDLIVTGSGDADGITRINLSLSNVTENTLTTIAETTLRICNSDGIAAGILRLTFKFSSSTVTCTAQFVNGTSITSQASDTAVLKSNSTDTDTDTDTDAENLQGVNSANNSNASNKTNSSSSSSTSTSNKGTTNVTNGVLSGVNNSNVFAKSWRI